MRKKNYVLAGILISFFAFLSSSESQVKERRFGRYEAPQEILSSNFYWARAYGGASFDTAYEIVPTIEGGYIVGGLTSSFSAGREDLWILKIDAEGTIEWQKSYGGSGRDGYYWVSIQQAKDGGYIVLTDTDSFGAGGRDLWILKLYQNGNVEWQKTYGSTGNERPGSIQPTKDGGYIVSASTPSAIGGIYDFWVIKLYSNGEIEWQKTYGGPDYEYADAVEQTTDGGYIVSGSTGYGGGYGCWILKLSPTGQIEWQKIYGSDERLYTYVVQVQQTKDKGYIVSDFTDRFGAGHYDFLILKLAPDGAIQWQKTYGGSDEDMQPYSIRQTQDEGYIVGGISSSFPTPSTQWDGWVLKLDGSGNIVWQKYYGTKATEWLFDIIPRSDGGYMFAGCTQSEGGGDFWIGKIDPNGNLGPCDHEGISNGQAQSTSIIPTILYAEEKSTNVIPRNSSVSPRIGTASSKLLCWNLNQPPENLSVTSEVNRSLFKKESYNRIQWSPNSYNNQFTITEYRIYRKEVPDYASVGYILAKTVPGNIFEFRDGPLDGKKTHYYVITSVDAQGHESAKSLEVHN